MTEAKVLADSLTIAGIGKAHQIYPDAIGRFYQIDMDKDWQSSVCAEKFITDWRVAGKVLESMTGAQVPPLMYDAIYEHFKGMDHGGLPRAIIEAWYAARETE